MQQITSNATILKTFEFHEAQQSITFTFILGNLSIKLQKTQHYIKLHFYTIKSSTIT